MQQDPRLHKPFHERRRQQFLVENYCLKLEKHFASSPVYWSIHKPQADSVKQAHAIAAQSIAEDLYMLWSLRYTAGQAVEVLRVELTEVVKAYEAYQRALALYENSPSMSPLRLDQLGDYERAMQLLGLCVLLHRPDLLTRLASLIDPGYRGEDTLYEDLLAFYQSDRVEIDEWYHEEPYTPLVRAIYEEEDAVASSLLKDYVEAWYPAFKYVPWHDGHLRVSGTDGDYFGYWAFEAGAIAYLCEIDDTTISHMVYPKDLVAWAREHAELSKGEAHGSNTPCLRCKADQPCPRGGLWEASAKADSRRQFKQGEIMPKLEADYGQTIWRWVDDASN